MLKSIPLSRSMQNHPGRAVNLTSEQWPDTFSCCVDTVAGQLYGLATVCYPGFVGAPRDAEHNLADVCTGNEIEQISGGDGRSA